LGDPEKPALPPMHPDDMVAGTTVITSQHVIPLEARAAVMASGRVQVEIVPASAPSITIQSLIIPETQTAQGILIRANSAVWAEIVARLGADWQVAFQLSETQWEELIAGAFDKAGYEEVTLTPRSGDHGRDVIAIKRGFGCVKIIGSVKAYAPGNPVGYDAVRALIGVMTGERDVSKGIITTTSDFPPRIDKDPFIAPFMPTRLELVNGTKLRQWLADLAKTK
jgi:restriction system protein